MKPDLAKVLLLCGLFFRSRVKAGGTTTTTTFQPAYVSEALLTGTSEVQTSSEAMCAIRTSRRSSAKLGCFDAATGTCTMSSLEVLPDTTNAQASPTMKTCFTSFDQNDCELTNGTIVKDKTTWYTKCDKENSCFGGIVLLETSPTYASTCNAPFAPEGDFACVAYFSTLLSWCEARMECLKRGSDLLILETENKALYAPYFQGLGASDIWVGLQNTNPSLSQNWMWTTKGLQITDSSAMWSSGEPHKSRPLECVRWDTAGEGLGDKGCDTLLPYVCQIHA